MSKTHLRPKTRKFNLREIESRIPSDLAHQLLERLTLASTGAVKHQYLLESVFSKFVSEETLPPESRRQAAIRKWLATEKENEATNDRLNFKRDGFQLLPHVPYQKFLIWCQDFTLSLLGSEVPPDEILIGSFSGGASTSRPRTKSHPAAKYLGKAHATLRCKDLVEDSFPDLIPLWFSAEQPLEIEVVPGNVLFTVPKNTDIDRCACKEPDLNMFIQKGIGSFLRKRLLRAGINLNDQSINRSLAREGSITGKLATLDLSSASDSVSESLVALFLPVNWYTLLDSVRSHVTIIDGEEHRNQMFSSMGNGYTFELESLLFYVLARATAYFTGTSGVVSVYGDDIICPTDMVHDLIYVLEYFGFSVNTDKSCISGPFRESCGGHYHNGLDITPFYIRGEIRTLPDLIDVANKLRAWASLTEIGICDPCFEPVWLWLKSFIPECLWGGEDLAFKYQLVSYDVSSARLFVESKRSETGFGGYLHWHNATWDRQSLRDAVETSQSSTVTGQIRLRNCRRKTVPTLSALWLSEL